MSADIYVLEADTDTTTIRVAGTSGYTTTAGSTPASTAIDCRIAPEAVLLTRSAYPDRRTSGASDPAAGTVDLENSDKGLDALHARRLDGRNVRMYRGQATSDFPGGWTKVLDCTQNLPSWTLDALRLNLIDARKYASVPINPDLFAGTNVPPAGLEGLPSDLKGKNKPLPFGARRNVLATLVNGPKQIYQISAISAITTMVYDEGIPITNGIAGWGAQTSGFGTTTIRALAYGAGLFVAVGDSGKLFTSPDGVTWTSRTSTFGATNINAITYGGGLFVIGGDAGAMATSPDGITWTSRTSGFGATNIRCLGYGLTAGANLWAAGGDAGKLFTSADATAWTGRTSGFTTNAIFGVAFGSNLVPLWVAVGANSVAATSPDGTTWTVNTSLANGLAPNYRGLAFGAAGFVVVGESNGGGSPYVITSQDGVTFSVRISAVTPGPFGSAGLKSVAYGNGRYVIATTDGRIGSSLDGLTWTLGAGSDGSHNDDTVAFGGTIFIIAGASGLLRTSASSKVYATLTDLQDDTPGMAPAPGTYGYIATSGGSYFRLGEPFAGDVTADILHGATAADRTMGQLLKQFVFPRAGLVAGDWSAEDIIAIDAANSAVLGGDITPEDGPVLCMTAAENIARSGGLWLTPDAHGVIRVKRLVPPSVNLFGQGDNLGTAPWAVLAGSPVATNAYASYAGRTFSRISNATSGPIAQTLTLAAAGSYRYRGFIRQDASVTGTAQILIRDVTSSVNLADILFTIASGGTISATESLGGEIVSGDVVRLAGPDNVYAFCLDVSGLAAGHSYLLYCNTGGGTATSFLLSGLELHAGSSEATNLLLQPDTLATSPWVNGGGSTSATNAVGTYAGRAFSRVSNATTGNWLQPVTPTVSGTHRLQFYIKADGVAGMTTHILRDDAGVIRAQVDCTETAAGAITAIAVVGTLTTFALMRGTDQVYHVIVDAQNIVGGNAHHVYASAANTATSILLSGFELFAGGSIQTIDQNVMRDPPLTPLDSGDDNQGIPPYRVIVRYGQNSHVMTNATLAAGVSDSERVRLSTEWQTAVAEDLSVLTAHPLSKPLTIDTLLTTEADAQAEANRVLALLSPSAADRAWYSFGVEATPATLAIEIGDTVDLIHERFGLGVGARAVVLGIAPKLDEADLTLLDLTCWL
jgi:hypothetical protein